jgi:3-oxoadipate enol-lactonase
MPEVEVDGGRVWFSVEGAVKDPVLLLSNSLGTTSRLWDLQAAAFVRAFRVVRYDTRGHGQSSAPAGEYSLDVLGRDALAVLDAVGVRRADVCGISLGGMTAMWLGLHAPERVGRLVLANTGARIGTTEIWSERIALVRAKGMVAIADLTPARWFTEDFRARQPAVVAELKAMVAACPPHGYVGCAAALRDADLRARIGAIAAPVLIITGASDPATPPSEGAWLCARIAGARHRELAAAHLSNIEASDAFTAAVLDFLAA